MLSTTSAPSLSRMSATKTIAAPSRANSRAVAAPMPLAAPVTRATLSFMRIAIPLRWWCLCEPEADDAGDDQDDRDDAQGRCGISEQHDPGDEGADRPDAGPYGISGSHRDRPLRQHQQCAA